MHMDNQLVYVWLFLSNQTENWFPGVNITSYCDKTFERSTKSALWNKISVTHPLDEVLICCVTLCGYLARQF